MTNECSLDIKVARRKAGLTQSDLAHLLDMSDGKMQRIESGKSSLTLGQASALTFIFGRSFESLFGVAMEQAIKELPSRLETIPAERSGWLGQFNRENTLNNIAARLLGEPIK